MFEKISISNSNLDWVIETSKGALELFKIKYLLWVVEYIRSGILIEIYV